MTCFPHRTIPGRATSRSASRRGSCAAASAKGRRFLKTRSRPIARRRSTSCTRRSATSRCRGCGRSRRTSGCSRRAGASDMANLDVDIRYTPPRTAVESALADLWAEVLLVDRVGLHDDFLELGGDSPVGAQLVARMYERLGIEI